MSVGSIISTFYMPEIFDLKVFLLTPQGSQVVRLLIL